MLMMMMMMTIGQLKLVAVLYTEPFAGAFTKMKNQRIVMKQRVQFYLRAAAPAADPGFSGPAFPPLVGVARVFRTGVSVVLLKVALLESSFLSGVEVGARAERFIACSLDCLLAFSTTNQPPKKHLKPPLRHGFNPLSSAPNEPQFLGRSVSNGRSGFLEKRQFASIFHH